jgi:hypothetical protein
MIDQQQNGLIRRDDPITLARYIWAVVHGLAMLAIDGLLRHPDADISELTRYAIARVRTGITI